MSSRKVGRLHALDNIMQLNYTNFSIQKVIDMIPYLAFKDEDDGMEESSSLLSGGGVRKAKLFCRLTDATVLVTADELLLSSSSDDLFPRMLQPKGDGSFGILDASSEALFDSTSIYFCGKL